MLEASRPSFRRQGHRCSEEHNQKNDDEDEEEKAGANDHGISLLEEVDCRHNDNDDEDRNENVTVSHVIPSWCARRELNPQRFG